MDAVAATVAAARAEGLRVDEPRVLKDGHNLVVHLAPSAVVARVGQAMGELRPQIRARELELTQWLAQRGLPVLPPFADEVFDAGGREFTLWPFIENERPADGHAAGRSLRQIDDALGACPLELRGFWPLFEMQELIARLDVPPDVEEVRAHVERELRYEPVPLHGDAHFRNCFFTAGGPLWSDLEDACLAPPEWDVPDADRLELLVLLRGVVTVTWGTFIHGRIARVDERIEWLRRNAP